MTNPRSAMVCAYRPDDCSFTAPNGPLTAMRRQAFVAAILRLIQVGRQSDAVAVLERDLLMIDLVALREGLVPVAE